MEQPKTFYGLLSESQGQNLALIVVDRLRSGRGTTRAEDAQGTPTQSHISPSLLVYEEYVPTLLLRAGAEREFCIDNLLVRIHFIIVMIRWTGLAPWEVEFPFPQVQDPEVAYQLAETLDKALSVAELIIRVPQPAPSTLRILVYLVIYDSG